MTRAPFQVLVYPYRQVGDKAFRYALLKRSDLGFWQAITGGGEGSETPLETAGREAFEETGIPPVTAFKDSHVWGEDVYVIPQYCFGVRVEDERLCLSHEHTAYRWLGYEEAQGLLKYDGDKTALWELDRRLRDRGPRD
jgi:dATP pyrophosphohydrolase